MRSLWVASAVSATDRGWSVLLEKQPQLGGTTGIAVGSFTANRIPMQRVAGIDDSLEDHVEDAGRFAPDSIEARNNAALRRWFLSHSAEILDYLPWTKTDWADKSFGDTVCTSDGLSLSAIWWGKLWPE
ncbi:MAG: FAD-binding protein [Limisphaerales bacterium]|nr:MAG: FAD-binding protein [Limisphaerales bacterium]